MSLITRQGKGSKLTIEEMDNNLDYLESLGVKEITLEDTTIKFERVDGSFLEVDTNNNILGVTKQTINDNFCIYRGIYNYDFNVATNIIDLKYILNKNGTPLNIMAEFGKSYHISGEFLNFDNSTFSQFTSALLSDSRYPSYALESPFNISDTTKSIIIIQPDDKIIINYKDTLNWLNIDGSIYRELDYKINSMTLQTDDKLIISGDFVENTITNSEMAFYSEISDYYYGDFGTGWYDLYFFDESIYEINGGPLKEGITYELIFDGVSYFAHFEEYYYVEFDYTGYRWFFVNDVQPELGVDELIIIYEELQPNYTPIFTRLNPDGSIDTSFDVGTGFSSYVNSIVVQSDGKILVGGDFTSYNGVTSNRIIRLNTDGSQDTSFVIGTGFNNTINSIVIQSDGKILVGGVRYTTSYNGVSSNRIIRLNSDGSQDTSFTIGTGFNNSVNSIAIQDDGKILVGGSFFSYNGVSANSIIRLNTDGSQDTSFNIGTGFNSTINSIVVQSDVSILVGGQFSSYNGVTSNRIINLSLDGSKKIAANNEFRPSISSLTTYNLISNENNLSLQLDYYTNSGIIDFELMVTTSKN